MDTGSKEEGVKPKRKYTPRPVCTDPNLKYKYKPKPGRKPKPKHRRRRHEIERTDAEQRRFSAHSQRVRKMHEADPELGKRAAAHLIEIVKTNPTRVSRLGIQNGMTRAQADEAWAKARAQAEELIGHMVEQGIIADVTPEDFERVVAKRADGTEIVVFIPKTDDGKAIAAIKEVAVIGLGPTAQQTKLAALRTLLEWTKAKPTTKVELTKAEDLLAAALKDIPNDGAE